jgi:hypothetical protein
MTDKTHLDLLVIETKSGFGQRLVEEFLKLARDPEIAAASYPAHLRALMDEQMRAVDDAAD